MTDNFFKYTTTCFQIIMPAFNEETSLGHILQHAMDYDYLQHLLIVDDASTDSTPQILERWVNDFGVRVIRLQQNCKKEGAIRVALEALKETGELKPYTILLDSDSMLIGDGSKRSISSQVELCIDQMKKECYKALAFRIDASLRFKPTLVEQCAFADYTAMQFDQWLMGLQGQLWVINGPGGIFKTSHLLHVLQNIVPDFETGDLLITVKLMKNKKRISFCQKICVETFVPSDIKTYFRQRRRWERGTTKVIWDEIKFYIGLFKNFRLLAVFTCIHLSVYFGLIITLGLILFNKLQWSDFSVVLIISAAFWFLISVIKGVVIKLKRPNFSFMKYCACAIVNSTLWLLVTTPARLVGFSEGIYQILSRAKVARRPSHELVSYVWLQTNTQIVDTTAIRCVHKS